MNIKEIYKGFYEQRTDSDRVLLQLEIIQKQLEALGISKTDYIAIEAQINAAVTIQEEEAFKDGFCAGINHIAGAMSFANARLSR